MKALLELDQAIEQVRETGLLFEDVVMANADAVARGSERILMHVRIEPNADAPDYPHVWIKRPNIRRPIGGV